ncbi:uncharacterized protein LACBIDRAFT_322442 [Laccaria bicolor S238N-H82]|uniref:Predicted protein n=1 Tax=Laccaria bicolor (strain S238N-H82 / ATCC MYA-4686) TaxID=486041 RepID=B0CWA9_LACBS|nr:uncharacterized protein LACBIDRAFT_322442 [Laccaria bicolor S238N-H82]EDR13035.1 predicted protein [Laccaria bicolor S238N-H82]|eukprot:XP_001875533.1 predicted protein [Laccaria bicolor S238N-H82]
MSLFTSFTGGLEDPPAPWLDPALHLISAPVEPLCTVGLPPPPSSQKTIKARCVKAPCTHVAAGSCNNQMCKACCEKAVVVCFFKNHNRGRRPVSVSDNPAHLARPLPQEPLRLMTASISVSLVAYLNADGQPTMLPLQDIKTWPTLNLSQIPSLAAKLGLSDLSDLSLFDPQNTIWIPTMDHALLVGTNDKIYVRRKELVSCGPASRALLEYLSPTRFELPRSSQKRRVKGSLDNGSSPARSTVSAHRDYSHDYAGLSSPPSSPSQSSSPPLPPTNCAVDDNSGTPHNPDLKWEFGTVPTPKGAAVVWPQGMYARDMAKGFDLLTIREPGETVASRFLQVFLGMVWKESTYHKNRKFWLGLSESTRQ